MSFCVLTRLDFRESNRMAFEQSETKAEIIREDWKKTDRRKAKTMHLEATLAALILALLLAFA